jgi:hypothetical protein
MADETDQDYLYRYQLLQAFGIEQWEDAAIEATIQELYTKVAAEPVFQLIFAKARENNQIKEMLEMIAYAEGDDSSRNSYAEGGDDRISTMSSRISNDTMIFRLLFKYEFFDLFHRCLVDFLHLNQKISEPILNKLLFAL